MVGREDAISAVYAPAKAAEISRQTKTVAIANQS
jgi:hypothetical protein